MNLESVREEPRPQQRRGAVFITYNGLLDPLGPSQILPYLERLNRDWPIEILSYERPERLVDARALAAMNERVRRQNIGWTWLRYHKWPSLLATTYDMAAGALALRRILARTNAGLVHARGYLPMEIALNARVDAPVLFDIRGLQPEEYVDGGVWREGELKWRIAKRSERTYFDKANAAVVLTENIKPYVLDRFAEQRRSVPIEVVPCCADLSRFRFDESVRAQYRAKLSIADDTTVLVYSGSIGTWYMPDEMARFARAFRDATGRRTCLLWMVNNDQTLAREASQRAGLRDDEVRVTSAPAAEVAAYLHASDAALALIRPSFSKRSSSPTKYGECLASGLPLLVSRDVGDGARLPRDVAVALERFDDRALDEAAIALSALLERPRSAIAAAANDLYDIDRVAMPRYRRLYQRLVLQ